MAILPDRIPPLVNTGASSAHPLASIWLHPRRTIRAVGLYLVLWGILAVWLCVIGVVGLSEVHAFGIVHSVATHLVDAGALDSIAMGVFALAVRRVVGGT